MDTKKIYDAQLNVSKIINDNLVDDLISRLDSVGESKYNSVSNCIEITPNDLLVEHDEYIREIIKEWIFDTMLSENKIDNTTYEIIRENLEILFNIIKTQNTILVYLH